MAGSRGVISLDPEQVAALERRIQYVRTQLDADQPVQVDEAALRSELIADAVRDFNAAWSDRRQGLVDLLTRSSEYLAAARVSMTEADAALAGSVGDAAVSDRTVQGSAEGGR